MNILIDKVPDFVLIDGQEYIINSGFRESAMFEILMQDTRYKDNEKTAMILRLYYPIIPPNHQKALEQIIWFYKCGDNKVNNVSTEKVEDIYSFEHDDEYIYSAFLSQYGIDLQDIEHLHWWKFRALFKGLKEDNLINKIMGYRAMKIDEKMSDNEKNFYRKMKEIYKIPDNRTIEEKENDFNNSMSGMF